MTAFFVPGVDPDEADARWRELAETWENPVAIARREARGVLRFGG